MEYLSIYGILNPVKKAQSVQKKTNQERGNILGIIPMMTEPTLNLHKKIRTLVENTFPDIEVFSIEIAVEEGQEFLKFINDANSDLKSISGIGKEYAKKITDQRPYMSLEDMRNKLGSKALVKKWLEAYQQKQS